MYLQSLNVSLNALHSVKIQFLFIKSIYYSMFISFRYTFLKDAPPVGGFATSWLHFLALCQRTGSCSVKEKEEQREKDREVGGKGDGWEGLLFRLLWFRERFIIKKTSRVQHLLDPLTPKRTHFLSFTQKHKCQFTVREKECVSLWWKLHTKAHTASISPLSQHLLSAPHLCPFPSITPSRALTTTSIHHSFLSPLSAHPFFCLHLPIHSSIHQLVQW